MLYSKLLYEMGNYFLDRQYFRFNQGRTHVVQVEPAPSPPLKKLTKRGRFPFFSLFFRLLPPYLLFFQGIYFLFRIFSVFAFRCGRNIFGSRFFCPFYSKILGSPLLFILNFRLFIHYNPPYKF